MAVKKLSLTAKSDCPRLDQLLSEWLPTALGEPVSKAKVRKLIVAGAVYLNRARVRIASKPIRVGARIDVIVDLERLKQDGRGQDRVFVMTAARILFEDEYLIAVDKPPGLPTQPTLDEARDNLFAAVKKFLTARAGGKPVYLGLHHRLDRDTSGVVLFTQREDANAGTGELFSKHRAQKTYQAATIMCMAKGAEGARAEPGETFRVDNFLGKDASSAKRSRFRSVRSGGDAAITDFRILERFRRALLIEARPKTGRTHQIRVHLSELGLPILGDATYNASREKFAAVPRLMLHAAALTFPHPIHQNQVTVKSPLPEDFIQCLQALKRE
jgi:RluA family pseudouridine synthase